MARFLFVGILAFAFGATNVEAAGYDAFAQGLSAATLEDNDRAIALFTSSLAAGDLNARIVPTVYFERGTLHFVQGDDADAIDDFSHAIALEPTGEDYWWRGRVHWSGGDLAGAVADFEQSVQLMPHATYVVLWLAMTRLRLGTLNTAALSDQMSGLDLDSWPKPVFDLYRGDAKPDDVMEAAEDAENQRSRAQKCEGSFYVAEWWLSQKKASAAKPLLEDARANCPHEFAEYAGTVSELDHFK